MFPPEAFPVMAEPPFAVQETEPDIGILIER